MAEEEKQRRSVPALQNPVDGQWSREAASVRNPLASLLFGLRARANMRALQWEGERAQAVGAFLDIAVATIEKMERTQDRARQYAVRQELQPELWQNERERLLDKLAEERHQRELTGKHRTEARIKADTDILAARQAQRAKRKFEAHKYMLGEERFKAEAARRKVGAAEAEMAMKEAGVHTPPPNAAPTDSVAKAGAISEMLEAVRAELRELRADGDDSEQRRLLLEDEAALERQLARVLKR